MGVEVRTPLRDMHWATSQIVCHPAWGGLCHDASWDRPPHATWKVLDLPVSISMGDWEDTFTMIGGSTLGDYSLGLYGLGCASIPMFFKGMIAGAFAMVVLSRNGSAASSRLDLSTSSALGLT